MRKLLKESFYQRTYIICLVLIAFSLPFSTRLNSALIILLTLNWLIEGNYTRKLEKLKFNKQFYILISFYLVNIIGLLYTDNQQTGLNILVKRMSLFLFPLVLATSK